MFARIHRNLHNARKGGPQWTRTERGKVVEYLDAIAMEYVTTRVRAGGVRRCQERGQREVCAFFDGYRIDPSELPITEPAVVRFDPRYDSQFFAASINSSNARVSFTRADYVALTESGIAYVWGAE